MACITDQARSILQARPPTLRFRCGDRSINFPHHGIDTKEALDGIGWRSHSEPIDVDETILTQLESLGRRLNDNPVNCWTFLELGPAGVAETHSLQRTNQRWVRDERMTAQWKRVLWRVKTPLLPSHVAAKAALAKAIYVYQSEWPHLQAWYIQAPVNARYPCGTLSFLRGHPNHCFWPHNSTWVAVAKRLNHCCVLVCTDGTAHTFSLSLTLFNLDTLWSEEQKKLAKKQLNGFSTNGHSP